MMRNLAATRHEGVGPRTTNTIWAGAVSVNVIRAARPAASAAFRLRGAPPDELGELDGPGVSTTPAERRRPAAGPGSEAPEA